MKPMPSLFISHGSPTIMIEENSPGRNFLASLGQRIDKPKAVLVVSAHWETETPLISAHPRPETIHDFYGFPKALYDLNYPAKGAPELADKVTELVGGSIDSKRGLDHGAWAPLSLIYPDADIPIFQLSLQSNKSPLYHYDIGKKLSPLREQGVLILASGSVTHNLSKLRWFDNKPDQWAIEFENWFSEAIHNNDFAGLLAAENEAPHFHLTHPTTEHWLPLYVALGAAHEKATLLHQGFEHKNLSMASARFD